MRARDVSDNAGEQSIDMQKAVVEPLALLAAPAQDENSTLPFLVAKNIIRQQLADLGRTRLDGSDTSDQAVTLRE